MKSPWGQLVYRDPRKKSRRLQHGDWDNWQLRTWKYVDPRAVARSPLAGKGVATRQYKDQRQPKTLKNPRP